MQRRADACKGATAAAGRSLDEAERIAAHQANARILDAVADDLRIPARRMLRNIARRGNTGAASLPILLHEPARDAELVAGSKILLVAFGGGLTWAATTLIWPAPHLGEEHL